MQIMCCVCGKVKTPIGWLDLDVFSEYDYSHGFCPDCAEKEIQKAREYVEKNQGMVVEFPVVTG